MKSSLISVVIPCRNEVKFIKRCIDSLINQKNLQGNFEIIVVDGMSDDGTKEILNKYTEQYANIFILENKQRFTPFALNIGINKASGEYIAIMGAHSEYDEMYLANCLDLFSKHPDVSCVGGPIQSTGDSSIGNGIAMAMSHLIGVGNAKHRFPDYEGYAEMACFPMFKKDVFRKNGYYDESLIKNQDDEFCFRLRRNGGLIYISPEVRSVYVVRSSYSSLFKQYFYYGYYRIAVLRKHKLPISYRQFVPVLFYSAVLVFIFIAIILKTLWIAIFLPSAYIWIILLFSLFTRKITMKIMIPFIISVLILHFSYTAGFISGIINRSNQTE